MAQKTNGTGKQGPIVLTGVNGFLGSNLLRQLEQDDAFDRIVAVDMRKPPFKLEKARFYKVDLTRPTADEELVGILADEEAETLVHMAFLRSPTHESTNAHELEAIGTMYVLNACHEVGIRKLVLGSTTMVYGAHPLNPNYLEEDAPLRGCPRSRFVRDKVGAERQVAEFSRAEPNTIVTVLRPCTILGPTVRYFWTGYFSRQIVPTIMGYDPLWQFVHEIDVIDAFKKVIQEDHAGAYNIVGDGIMPLSTILNISGRVPLPLPRPALHAALNAAWLAGQFDIPPTMLDYLRFMWVAEGERARERMGFHPKYSTREALQAFLGMQRLRAVRLVD